MWMTVFSWLGSFLSGPVIKGLLQAYTIKKTNDDNFDTRTVNLALKEEEVQSTQLQLQNQLKVAEIGHWYEPDHLFGYIMVIYFAKITVWDKVLGYYTHASTDALTGDAQKWAGMIMVFYVGMRGVSNITSILKRKNS